MRRRLKIAASLRLHDSILLRLFTLWPQTSPARTCTPSHFWPFFYRCLWLPAFRRACSPRRYTNTSATNFCREMINYCRERHRFRCLIERHVISAMTAAGDMIRAAFRLQTGRCAFPIIEAFGMSHACCREYARQSRRTMRDTMPGRGRVAALAGSLFLADTAVVHGAFHQISGSKIGLQVESFPPPALVVASMHRPDGSRYPASRMTPIGFSIFVTFHASMAFCHCLGLRIVSQKDAHARSLGAEPDVSAATPSG